VLCADHLSIEELGFMDLCTGADECKKIED
jgi:hypothetical protein